jgi:hypothetical protein
MPELKTLVEPSGRAAVAAAAPTGRYIYAVVDSAEDREFGLGIAGGQVYAISDGKIAAVVSDVPNRKIRPERRSLAAHNDVLKGLQREFTVLPMAFGIIAGGDADVFRILSLNRQALVEQIRRVCGRVEMGLRVSWDVPNIFEFFVATHPELTDQRDRLFQGGRQPSRDELVAIGMAFDRLLREERARHTQRVSDTLRPYCSEITENEPKSEKEVANLACLVARSDEKRFEKAVFEAARAFDNHYSFDFSGPWPPHHFVELNLRM